MNLRKIGFFAIIIVLGLMFSSCEEDEYRWVKGQVRSVVTLNSDNRGYFVANYSIDIDRDVYDEWEHRLKGVRDIKYVGGDLIILADEDYLFATIRLLDDAGRILYECELAEGYGLDRYGNHIENVYEGAGVQKLQMLAAEYMRRYGYANIEFLATSDFIGRSQMRVDIYMDIDAYARW